MSLFRKVSKDRAELESVRSELNALRLENTSLQSRIDDTTSTIEKFAGKEASYKQRIANYEHELTKVKEAHKIEVDKLTQSINRKVNTQLASIGVNTFAPEIFATSQDHSDSNLLTVFNSLGPVAQREFYEKHKDKLARSFLNK